MYRNTISFRKNHTVPENGPRNERTLGLPAILNGCGPPKNKVTITPLIVTVFMNSARKNNANRMLEYSVLKPPTSSCSASTRSNGGRFSSAVAAIRKMANGTNAVDATDHLERVDWEATIPLVLKVPATRMTAARLRPRAAS